MLTRLEKLLGSIFVAGIALLPGLATAHTVLITPKPLSTDDNAKTAPCGCTFGEGTSQCAPDYQIASYDLGETITITWNETIDHTGEFRVSFVAKSPEEVTEEEFEASEIQVTVPDEQAGGLRTAELTLPSTPCENCTVQVRQFMADSPNPYYYSCAAVRVGEAPSVGGGSGDGGGGASNGNGGSAAGNGGSDSSGPGGSPKSEDEPTWEGPVDDGCTAAAGGASGRSALGLSLVAMMAAFAVGRSRRGERAARAPR